MAIQIPNPGTGNGATGDNEFVLWSKVKDNFSDKTNAASKLIGTETSEVALNVDLIRALAGAGYIATPDDINDFRPNFGLTAINISSTLANRPSADTAVIGGLGNANSFLQYSVRARGKGEIRVRTFASMGGGWADWGIIYTSANTTKDSNGFIKAASPIIKVFADKVELNGDAENQNVTYKKNGIGDYTITTVSGLSTDGWYIELPKDMNGNPKVAVTLSEVDGVISLKSYKRIFSMETFTFEPDLDTPLDIPDTRWIDIRLNEIPFENEGDIQPEEVDLDK